MKQLEDPIMDKDKNLPAYYEGAIFNNATYDKESTVFLYKEQGTITQEYICNLIDPHRYQNEYSV